jgi:glutaconyl-CoA/methylmalonyl-CoA decarboxylase subunit delta
MNYILLNISTIGIGALPVALLGIVIVFVSLFLIYLVFTVITKIMDGQAKKRMKMQGQGMDSDLAQHQISSGVDAAISAALFLYLGDLHDEENTIMTIKKVSKTYSPWSSKIYSVRWPLR